MKIINNLDATDYGSNLYRSTAQITNGETTIERIMYFQAENLYENAIDVISLEVFPQKNSAHPLNASFKYYGNATVEPVDSEGKYWKAVLQYSTSNPNATDINGNKVTSDTEPWKLLPDNISFTYPETTVPFDLAYNDKGELAVPVANSAGDAIPASRNVCSPQMTFTFAVKNWDVNNSIKYGDTINSSSINVCGLTIPSGAGLLRPPEASYITVYEDGSDKIKWQYYSVSVTIVFDIHGVLFLRKFLNVGDRAKFKSFDLSDDPLLKDAGVSGSITACETPSQICSFRKNTKMIVAGKNYYQPLGDVVTCSWTQYLAAREKYLNASSVLMEKGLMNSTYELQCEQEKSMPLDKDGYIDSSAIESKQYLKKEFNAYPKKSWASLNLPKKGLK